MADVEKIPARSAVQRKAVTTTSFWGGGVSGEMPTSVLCEHALVKFLQIDVLNLVLHLSKSKT